MVHARCFACGAENPQGLGLVFSPVGDDTVTAECIVAEDYQGYAGVVQGGIVATILDSAMTNCLFHLGIEAMTVRLNVRFHRPVPVGEPITIEAHLVRHTAKVYELESTVSQSGQIRAAASGTFMAVGRERK